MEHMIGSHARLGPSSAERWLSCPASVKLAESLPVPPESRFAREGTAFHALAETYARFLLLGDHTTEEFNAAIDAWRMEFGDPSYDEYEMKRHAIEYVEMLRDILAEIPASVLMLEQRMPTGIDQCWGTGDAVIVSPTVVVIVDAKYGKGVRVEALDNPQLMLYGVGALEKFGDLLGNVEVVRWCVFQPRLDHIDCAEMPATDLRKWRDAAAEIADVALNSDSPPFGPSEAACRWCPVSGNCTAQMEHELSVFDDFGEAPGTMSVEDLAAILPRLDGIEAWIKAVRDSAFDRAFNKEEAIPGYKVVRSSGRRYVSDAAGLIEALDMLGFDRSAYTKPLEVKGIGDLEKLGVIDVVTPFISKSEGKPALAPESDRRQAIDPHASAISDFDD